MGDLTRPAAVDALAKMARAHEGQYAFPVGAESMRKVVDYIEELEEIARFEGKLDGEAIPTEYPTDYPAPKISEAGASNMGLAIRRPRRG